MLDWLGVPALWDQVVDFFTISPFWLYLFYGVLIIVGAAAAAWLFPVLRSLSGAAIVATIFGLFSYRRGEKDAEARQKAKEARERARQQRGQQPNNNNWWPFS